MLFEGQVLLIKAAPCIFVLMKIVVVLLLILETLPVQVAMCVDITWVTAFSVLMTATGFTMVRVGGITWWRSTLRHPGIEVSWALTAACLKSCSE